MKKILILCLVMAGLAFGQATGNLWPYYEFESADSAFLILHDATGVDTLHSVTDTNRIDTSISCGSFADGINIIEFAVYYVGDTTKYSATDIFNNIASGSEAAAGSLSIKYDVALCDSIMMIHESQGTIDTSIWTSAYGIDTVLACASMDVGVHNFIVRFLYNGVSDWLSGSLIFHNTAAATPTASTANTCAVTVLVMNSDGTPKKGVRVSAWLTGNVADSAGHMIVNWPKRDVTDVSGAATINCVWSSYLIPETQWRFRIVIPGQGSYFKDVTVPRSTSYSLPWSIE